MRYLVCARLKPKKETALRDGIECETLGAGSVAGDEYLRNMEQARLLEDGTVRWVETCYCPTPLEEEKEYWEEFFELARVMDAHDRRRCRDLNGEEPWACSSCGCTAKLEQKLGQKGCRFLDTLRKDLG